MNKQELINTVSSSTGYTLSTVSEIVQRTLETIAYGLVSGESVKISPIGSFKPVVRKPRVARNINTGQPIQVPEKKTVAFKPSTALESAMKGGTYGKDFCRS